MAGRARREAEHAARKAQKSAHTAEKTAMHAMHVRNKYRKAAVAGKTIVRTKEHPFNCGNMGCEKCHGQLVPGQVFPANPSTFKAAFRKEPFVKDRVKSKPQDMYWVEGRGYVVPGMVA